MVRSARPYRRFTWFLWCLVLGCGGSGNNPTQFAPEANLPLYFTVAGSGMGQGAVYRIARLTRGALAEPELVLGGLDYPAGMAVDRTGALYIAEKLPAPYGRVKKLEQGDSAAVTVIEGLDNPVAVAVDSLNHLYVSESDGGRISKADAAGTMHEFAAGGLTLPRDLALGIYDELYFTELDGGIVSSVARDGKRQVLARDLQNPFGLALNTANELHVIINGDGTTDSGSIAKVASDGTMETLVDGLFNPIALAYNNAHGFFIIEGSPANRIVSYSLKTRRKTIVATTDANPYAIAMSPL